MKLNVTCAGCEVSVEEIDGQCVVSAMKDGEIVEEFAIDCEESEEGSEEEMEEMEDEMEDMEDEIEDMEEEVSDEEVSEAVKSFGDFFKPTKAKK